ncbi:hypothetical protein F1737_04345 [Methanoplanus sp. FWC-SCC4]|uniref:Uncharacterized protein n=1 Tax=Methanochimaera problematica TaxID=2609417 RepID=A0AA97FAU5_9EURY|nr:hypothetical protein [Methanoplanus sp. FWC-SCC4]WOF15985.1 hypothetical protein F1737_04345 [Methanoplanus sp. FWC-SCC4]
MDEFSIFINYLNDLCIRSGTETISSRIEKIERIVVKHQNRRAGRYLRTALSRTFKGSCIENRTAFRKMDIAVKAPPTRLKSILKQEGF